MSAAIEMGFIPEMPAPPPDFLVKQERYRLSVIVREQRNYIKWLKRIGCYSTLGERQRIIDAALTRFNDISRSTVSSSV